MTPKNSVLMTRIAAWVFLIVAFIWGLAPYQTINAPARIFLDILNWPFGDAALILTQSEMWLSAVGAGLLVAMSIMLLGIVVPAIKNQDRKTVRVTIWAFIAWYIVDGAGSIASGVASNVFFNSIFLALILIPLVTLRYEKNS